MRQGREDLGTHQHVLLDLLVFLGGERALLVQDLLPDADLADIVQPARGSDRFHLSSASAISAAIMAERSATRAECPRR